jgi:hypothetical protein
MITMITMATAGRAGDQTTAGRAGDQTIAWEVSA